MAKIYLYNTLSRKKELFKPLKKDYVRVYDCGPTVYFYAHIGNMWRFLISDFLRRVLQHNGYKVKQLVNITDVGHLTEDDLLSADTGEDKMEVAAKKEKKTVWQIADFYTKAYFEDREKLNMLKPSLSPKATEHIKEMIELIRKLEKKGYAYQLKDRVCYDVAKFKEYGKLSGKKLSQLKAGARLEPIPEKKNPYDFSLWVIDDKHLMKWDSPWGVGYPGWHIECSAMAMKHLGEQIDIHSGGEDNIFPHHENEIAQSEGATGKRFVRYWIHVRHNLVNGIKMSKSKGSFYLLSDLAKKGFSPLAFRYLCLTNHYRKNLDFTWPALRGAERALLKLRLLISRWEKEKEKKRDRKKEKQYEKKFLERINNDLAFPQAIALVWQMVDDQSLPNTSKLKLLFDWDQVLGLRLAEEKITIPQPVIKLAREREQLRKKGDFTKADQIRKKIRKQGYSVNDTDRGWQIEPLLVDD